MGAASSSPRTGVQADSRCWKPGRWVTKPALVPRCQERKTEAYIWTGLPPNVEYGRYNR